MMLVDTHLCTSASAEPFATVGVSVNNVDLGRVIEVQEAGRALPIRALAFTVLADGTVRP